MPASPRLPVEIPNFFSDRPWLFCLPISETLPGLPDKIASEASFLLKQAGMIQYSVKAKHDTGHETIPYRLIFLWNERAVEGEDYFRYLIYALARILNLPFIIHKARDGRIYSISTNPASGVPAGKIEPVETDPEDYAFNTRILAKALGDKWLLEEVIAVIHPFEGMNGAMMRDMIYRGASRYGEAYLYDKLELEPDWNAINAAPYIYDEREEPAINVQKEGRRGNWPDATAEFFPGDNPVYLLTAFRGDRTIIDNVRRNEWLLCALTEAGCFCLYGKRRPHDLDLDESTYILAQNVLSSQSATFFEKLLELYAKSLALPESAGVLTREQMADFEPEGGRFPTAGLEGAARRDRLDRAVAHKPDSLPDLIRNISRRDAEDAAQTAPNEAASNTPMHEVIDVMSSARDVFCLKVSEAAWPDAKKLKQFEKIVADTGCAGFILSATRDGKNEDAELIFALPQNDGDNAAIQFMASCARASGDSGFLYKTDDGHFFIVEAKPDCSARLLSQPIPKSPEDVEALLEEAFGTGSKISENSEIRKFSESKGFSAIDRRARTLEAMNGFGLNGVARLLRENVEPLPFTVEPLENPLPEDAGDKTPDGPYFTVKGKPFQIPFMED